MVYEWNFSKYKASAQDVGELFEELEKRDGELTPESVLGEARSETSIIHNDFEWDNDVAAEKYRLKQAQQMISLLIVVSDDSKPTTRAFVNSNQGVSKSSYMSVGKAMEDETIRKIVLENAKREMVIFRSKYAKYKELAKVIAAINEITEGA